MARAGWNNRYQQGTIDEINRQISQIDNGGPLPGQTIAGLKATLNANTNSVQVSFSVVSLQGLLSVLLLRSFTRDTGSAKLLQSWSAADLVALGTEPYPLTYSDSDPALVGQAAYYWVKVVPSTNPRSASYFEGPVTVDQSGGAGEVPFEAEFLDASHDAVDQGFVNVSVAAQLYSNDDTFNSLKIYAAGYLGQAAAVAVAQQQQLSFRFALEQTGETITLTAVTVSITGVEAPIGSAPTKSLTLGAAATVPAAPMRCRGLELGTGVQINFPASPEPSITQYLIYRGTRGGGFGAASQIGTVAPSGERSYSYLDTAGLTGTFEWYVVAKNAVGNSAASAAVLTNAFNTSADLPPNTPSNSTNFATVDSVDNGVNATIRVYGTGGVGSAWTRVAGYGNETYPSYSAAGFTYGTAYYVLYDKSTASYVVTATFPNTIPDNRIWVGKVTTVNMGGGGGSNGGGGGGGGTGGCVELGTPVEYPDGTMEYSELEEPCFEWVTVKAEGRPEVTMHPDTLVAVWKRACELKPGELLDVSEFGVMAPVQVTMLFRRPGTKVKRTVFPSRTYRARGYRLHNAKVQ